MANNTEDFLISERLGKFRTAGSNELKRAACTNARNASLVNDKSLRNSRNANASNSDPRLTFKSLWKLFLRLVSIFWMYIFSDDSDAIAAIVAFCIACLCGCELLGTASDDNDDCNGDALNMRD